MLRKSALELGDYFSADKQAVQRALNFLCDVCEETRGIIKREPAEGRNGPQRQKWVYFAERSALRNKTPSNEQSVYGMALNLVRQKRLKEETREAFQSFLARLYYDSNSLEPLGRLEYSSFQPFLEENTDHLVKIFEAILNRKRIQINYVNRPEPIHLKPLKVFLNYDQFMLLALENDVPRTEWKENLKQYRMSKIESLEVTEKEFSIPDLTDTADCTIIDTEALHPATVVLKFHKSRGHSLVPLLDQETPGWDAENQTLTMHMKNTRGLAQLVLSLGSFVELVEPENQRKKIQRIYAAALKHYR